MKILFLYKYIKDYDFDSWLHLKYIEYILKNNLVDVCAYGPEIHLGYKDLNVIQYNPKLTMEDLHKELGFTHVVCMTKSRMFGYYNPHTDEAKDCWLPKDFTSFDKAPKVLLDEDHHYEKDLDWCYNVKINLLIQRHYNSYIRSLEMLDNYPDKMSVEWLPFSVDTQTFCDDNRERIPRIGFAGSSNSAYPDRQYMIGFFKNKNLMDVFQGKEKINNNYVDFLKSYTFVLSSLSKYNITPAKMFEIMASGAIMLTNDDGHLIKLFPKESYITYSSDSQYKLDSLVKTVNNLLKNQKELIKMKDLSINTIKTKHTHEIRTQELVDMLEKL